MKEPMEGMVGHACLKSQLLRRQRQEDFCMILAPKEKA
jgi:hypothetical protein